MALVDTPLIYVPRQPIHNTTTGGASFGSLTMTAAADKVAAIMAAPKTGSIRKVNFRTGTVTTGATVDVRVETISASDGNPSGTLWGTNTNASQIIDDIHDNTWFTTTLTADANVNRGDLFAVAIVNPGTPGNMAIATVVWSPQPLNGFPYSDRFVTAAWTKSSNTLALALEYADGSIELIDEYYPFATVGNDLFNVNTVAADERGIRIVMPFTGRLYGAWQLGAISNASDIIVYDSGSSVLSSKSVDADIDSASGLGEGQRVYTMPPVTLTRGQTYRLVAKPTTTSNHQLYFGQTASSALADALDLGTSIQNTQRVDAGAWTDDATKRPFLGLIFDQVDVTAAASSTAFPDTEFRSELVRRVFACIPY